MPQPPIRQSKSDDSLIKPSAALILSERDVERLLVEETPEVRIDIVKKVAQGHNENTYSLREFALAEQIFRLLVQDTEVSVREALSESLKDNPKIPREIILSLANDVDEVALSVIERSSVLTDEDLITLVKTARHSPRRVAVARRTKLSETISQALVETHDPEAVCQLMKNSGASIAPDAFQEILRTFDKDNAIINAMATRTELPLTIAEKIVTLVSDTLSENLRQRFKISPATIAQETEKTRETATLKLVEGPVGAREVEKLVEQLQLFGRLTPSIILTSLCRGNLYFFETSLARLSNVPVRNAQLLIHDKGGLGFKRLYTKAGLPEKFFAACKLLLEVVADMQRTGEKKDANLLAQKLLAKASEAHVDNLSYILALIRQNG